MKRRFTGALYCLLAITPLAAAQAPAALPPLPSGAGSAAETAPPASPRTSDGNSCGGQAPSCCPVCEAPRAALSPPCGPPGRFWFSAEYLLWWTRKAPLPPLASTSPATSLGIPGQPNFQLLYGGSGADFNERSGARFTA